MKPIYAGSYQRRGRGRGKIIFTLIVLVQLAAVGIYLYLKSDKSEAETPAPPPFAEVPAPAPVAAAPTPQSFTPETRAILSDVQAAMDAGQVASVSTTRCQGRVLRRGLAPRPPRVAPTCEAHRVRSHCVVDQTCEWRWLSEGGMLPRSLSAASRYYQPR